MLSQKLSEFLSKIPLDFRSKTNSMHTASHCSCSICDSISCFKLRNKNSLLSCSCSTCKPSISCIDSAKCFLHIPTEKIKEKPNSNKNKKHIEKQCVQKNESIKCEKQNDHESINAKKQFVCESSNDKKQRGIESSDDNKHNVCKPINNKRFEIDKHSHTKNKSKDTTDGKKITRYEKSLTQIESVDFTYTKKDRDISKAELSAQIMNVPYEELKRSLSIPRSNKDSCTGTNEKFNNNNSNNLLTIPDILTKLKEIYKVCSCKVCECIPKITLLPKEMCTCSPCDCDECTNSPNLHSRCSCVKCVRTDCRGKVEMTEQVKSCNCEPCECLECKDRSNDLCICKPCQCAECTINTLGNRSIIVAHVQGNFSQSTCEQCQCEPCECANCTHNYSTVATSLRRDISTDISYRQCQCSTCVNDICQLGREDCRCDQNKIMRKPVRNDNHDYDIHRTVLSDQNVRKYYNIFDTIAMFALSDSYSNSVFHSKENCKCLECECLMCKKKDETYSNKTSFKYLSQDNLDVIPCLNNTCKCVSCECEICPSTQNKIGRRNTTNITKSDHKGCACNTCDCVLCKGIRYDKTCSNTAKGKTTHFIFEPATKDIPYENTFSLKKGKLLTPSAFEAKISSPSKLNVQSCFNNRKMKKPTEKRVSLKVNTKESFHELSHHRKLTVSCTGSEHNFLESENSHQTSHRNIVKPTKNDLLDNVNLTNQALEGNETYIVLSNIDIHLRKSRVNNNIFNHNIQSPLNVNTGKPLEKYWVSDRNSDTKLDVDAFDNNTIVLNSNVAVANIDEQKLQKINGEKLKLQEKDDRIREMSILSIYKLSSKSIICDNIISRERNSEGYDINDTENKNSIYLRTPKGDSCVEPDNDKPNNVIANSNMVKVEESVKSGENNEICETIYKDIFKNKNKNTRYTKSFPIYSKMYRRLLNHTRVSKMKKTRRQRKLPISDLNDEYNKAKERLENTLDKQTENPLDVRTNDIMKSINNFFSPELNMLNKIKRQVDDIDKSIFNKPWPILRKNVSLNCTAVRRSMGVCTIPDMEMCIKCPLKSMSLSTANNDDNKIHERKALNRLLVEVNNILNSPILRSLHSGCYLDTTCKRSDFTSTKQIQTTQTTAFTIRVDKETNCNIWQSMENLQSNMKYILQMILARAVNKSDLMTPKLFPVQGLVDDFPKINSAKSSCEGLKAIFIGLRKVSDHTLLVRWKAPLKLEEVQGYELQIDGRSVKKIFSPTRCMAVLTCLPRCDKILVTIRTLITSGTSPDHYPATTIVYRPKLKVLM